MTAELAYQAVGTGPPIIILHGLFGSSTNWRTVAKQLAGNYQVFLVDQRNHGSSPHTDSMTYTDMAEDMGAFMDRSNLARATLVGHSMGGKTAMAFALQHPERVESLVVVDVSPVTYGHDFINLIKVMRSIDLEGVARRADVDTQLANSIEDSGLRLFLLQNLVDDRPGFRWRINLDAIEANMPRITAAPETPANTRYPGRTLFVRGERSEYILPEHQEIILELFPNAEITTVQEAGHWIHAERPEQFMQVLGQFLS